MLVSPLTSTRIRICLIDRLLDFELASGKVRLDVPAKPYDNVELARLGDEHLKFFIQNMHLLFCTSLLVSLIGLLAISGI